MYRYISLLCLAACAWIGFGSARAEDTEDIITLAKKGLGEDVLLAMVERPQTAYALTADQIVKLKDAGVSEKVLAAMLRKRPASVPAAPVVLAPAPAAPVAGTAAPGAVLTTVPGAPLVASPGGPAAALTGTLDLENVDDRPWGYQAAQMSRTVWIAPGDTRNYEALPAHGSVILTVAAGPWEVRYVGGPSGNPFRVLSGEKTMVLVSRVETSNFEGLYTSIFEKGERTGGGRLAVLRQPVTSTQPPTTYQYQPTDQTVQLPDTSLYAPTSTYNYSYPYPDYSYPSYDYPYYYSYPYVSGSYFVTPRSFHNRTFTHFGSEFHSSGGFHSGGGTHSFGGSHSGGSTHSFGGFHSSAAPHMSGGFHSSGGGFHSSGGGSSSSGGGFHSSGGHR